MVFAKMNKEATQILDLVITPTHKALGLWSQSADRIVLCTFQTETQFDAVRQDIGPRRYGAAYGLSQMEKATFDDHVKHMEKRNPEIKELIIKICNLDVFPDVEALTWNDRLAVCMTRYHYKRVPDPLPDVNDLEGMARYWKKYYNTPMGAGTVEKFIKDCKQFF